MKLRGIVSPLLYLLAFLYIFPQMRAQQEPPNRPAAEVSQQESVMQRESTPQQERTPSNPFPAFDGSDLDGNAVDSGLFAENSFTVINFWFNGCIYCIEEFGELNTLNEQIRSQGGEVIGINVETLDGNEEAIALAKELLASEGAYYRNIRFDPYSEAGSFAATIMAYPTTLVVDRTGDIVGTAVVGGIDYEENMRALQSCIDEAIARDTQ